jgi:hypothetical protein
MFAVTLFRLNAPVKNKNASGKRTTMPTMRDSPGISSRPLQGIKRQFHQDAKLDLSLVFSYPMAPSSVSPVKAWVSSVYRGSDGGQVGGVVLGFFKRYSKMDVSGRSERGIPEIRLYCGALVGIPI